MEKSNTIHLINDIEMNRVVTKLSGGQQQRVEPTGNLDKENTQNIIDIFKKLTTNIRT